MNLRDLRYLVAIAEHRHFGKAAEACFVSQPTLSMQIKKLEDFLGVPLIERNSRQVMLTAAGERIVEQAKRVLKETDELLRQAQQARDPFAGELRLGVIPTVAPYLLPRLLPRVKKALPKIMLQLQEAQTAVLERRLMLGEVEAIIVALPCAVEHTVQEKLYEEPFFFAVPKDHPKARKKTVSVSDLAGEQVLLLEDGHCLRDQALSVCNSGGAMENVNFRGTSIETLRQMVSSGAGTTLMPELAIRTPTGTTDAVRYIPFRESLDGKMPQRVIGLCWRESSPRHALLAVLVKAIVG